MLHRWPAQTAATLFLGVKRLEPRLLLSAHSSYNVGQTERSANEIFGPVLRRDLFYDDDDAVLISKLLALRPCAVAVFSCRIRLLPSVAAPDP